MELLKFGIWTKKKKEKKYFQSFLSVILCDGDLKGEKRERNRSLIREFEIENQNPPNALKWNIFSIEKRLNEIKYAKSNSKEN